MKRLLIHIPKNGGRTLQRSKEVQSKIIPNTAASIKPDRRKAMERVMSQHGEHIGSGMQHTRWRDVKDEITANHPAFAVVRNPWSKVVSRYTYNERVVKRKAKNAYYSLTFDEFLEERHKWIEIPYYWQRAIRNWYPQKDHVVDDDGVLRCDMLRFEHFDEDVVSYLNLSRVPDKRNVSNGEIVNNKIVNKVDYKTFYNDKTIQIIADWYKEDIEFFGFDFDTTATKNIWANNG